MSRRAQGLAGNVLNAIYVAAGEEMGRKNGKSSESAGRLRARWPAGRK